MGKIGPPLAAMENKKQIEEHIIGSLDEEMNKVRFFIRQRRVKIMRLEFFIEWVTSHDFQNNMSSIFCKIVLSGAITSQLDCKPLGKRIQNRWLFPSQDKYSRCRQLVEKPRDQSIGTES